MYQYFDEFLGFLNVINLKTIISSLHISEEGCDYIIVDYIRGRILALDCEPEITDNNRQTILFVC
jgi:hypothetical protein